MPETKYETDTQRMVCLGLDVNSPVDAVRPGRFPILKNVRSHQEGRIEPREGLTVISGVVTGKTPLHSIKRLNNPRTNDYTLVAGVQDALAYGKASFTRATYAGGNLTFSGNPLALVGIEPQESPEAWMLIADSAPNVDPPPANARATTLKKIKVDGTVHQFGLPAPTTPPTAALAQPKYNYVDPDTIFEYSSDGNLQAGWPATGDAAAATRILRINTTITAITYDSGTSGWATIEPASMAQMAPGVVIRVNTGGGSEEDFVVQEVHPGSVATTTIANIKYDDVSNTGLCSIVLTTPFDMAARNSYLCNRTPAPDQYARVISVTEGPGGKTSLRLSTGANTWAAGETVQFVGSIRGLFANTHAAAETLIAYGAQTVLTFSSGVGALTRGTAPNTYDWSLIDVGAPTTPDDYVHFSVRMSRPDLVTEIKLMFDVDSATNDFTRNYYYIAIRPSDLTPSVRSLQSLESTRANMIERQLTDQPLDTSNPYFDATDRYVIDEPVDESVPPDDAVSLQADTGDVQWTDFKFRISEFIRVGTDLSRTWANIAAIKIQATVTATVTLGFDDIHLGGGYGPDQSETGIPYIYRYRARVSTTNSTSNPSPPLRGGVSAYRQAIIVSPPVYNFATEADLLDIERLGGDLTTWHYVGTVANTGTPAFTDDFPDDVVVSNPETDIVSGEAGYGLNSFQPWPIKDIPRSGTTAANGVAGTSITDVGSNFNVNWSLGTEIKINGISYTVYKVHSTSFLEIFENAGSQTSVSWVVPAPVLVSQPLPCVCGPQLGVYFAVGDNTNPGRLYYTRPGAEGCFVTDYYDVTSASEPLINLCMYNGRVYVWSSERMFEVISVGGNQRYQPIEIPGARGLFARWAFAVGTYMYYLATDGIYASNGGASKSITDEWLGVLFPSEGEQGETPNGFIGAPNVVNANATNLRLNFASGYLYFDYTDTGGARNTLLWKENGEQSGWFFDTYGQFIQLHYGEEGQGINSILVCGADNTTAVLYRFTGNTDAGTAISCQVRTPCRDQGEPRVNKLYGDIMIDSDPKGVSLTCIPGTNNFLTNYSTTFLTHSGRAIKPVEISTGWVTGRNIAIDIAFTVSTDARPWLYIWEPRWTFEAAPISAFSWEISPSTLGMDNFKHLGWGKFCHVATANLSLVVTLDGAPQTALTITHNSGAYKETFFRFPVYKAKLYKFRVSSTAEFRLGTRDSYIEVKEWGNEGFYRKLRVFSDYGFIEG